MSPSIISLIALLAVGSPDGALKDDVCAAAVQALPQKPPAAGRVLYSTGPAEEWAKELLSRADLELDWRGRTPTAPTLQLLKQRPARSALECENVRRTAAAEGELMADGAIVKSLDAVRLKAPLTTAFRVTAPVVNPAGNEAIVLVSSATNQVGGDAWLVLLTKARDGRWVEAGRKLLFVG